MTRLFVLFALALPLPATAYNGTIVPPTLVKGQHVYTIPEGFYPEGLSAQQQQQLNGELESLHYPFYVVVLKDLPDLGASQNDYARSNGFRGDANTQRIEVGTAMLMEDWAASQSGYNPGYTSVFVMAFNPRKFAWHPGLTWVSKLGLDKGAQDPYTQQFMRSAKHKPADYGQAIANLAHTLDEYAFDRTDPERIAARAEVERKRAEALRLQAAQGALDSQILRLEGLLDPNNDEYRPSDVSSYTSTLLQAKTVRSGNDPEKMLTQADTMKGSVDVLEEHVNAAKSAARRALLWLLTKWLLFLSLAVGASYFILRRRREELRLLSEFRFAYGAWARKVSAAHQKWSEHYLQREGVIGLDDVTGRTKELWDATTKMVDEILIRITAMQQHLKDCDAICDKGHYFNFAPLKQAILELDAPFQFDTGVINEADLFGGETITLTVSPSKFAAETKDLFATSIAGWKRLQKAAEERVSTAVKDFPHRNLDTMFQQAQDHNIPLRWFKDHPLFGDDSSDATFYEGLDALRVTDPLAYVEKLEDLRTVETAQMAVLDALVAARKRVKDVRVDSIGDYSGTIVSPDDDPAVTITKARQEEDKLEGLFQTETDHTSVVQQASNVGDLYRCTAVQVATIKAALDHCQDAVVSATTKWEEAKAAIETAQARIKSAISEFKRMGPAEGSLKSAQTFSEKGARKIGDAKKAIEDRRHLAARRMADEAREACVQACAYSAEAVQHIVAMEKERDTFKQRVANMDQTRSQYDRKMSGLGTHRRNLPQFQQPSQAGVLDYAAMSLLLDTQEAQWRSETRRAEAAYEAEQQAIRAAQEAADRRRRDDDEADRRRRSSYSSSYSSSSSSSSDDSWGGGGFGGSSGDFGGGGFGGSSGDF